MREHLKRALNYESKRDEKEDIKNMLIKQIESTTNYQNLFIKLSNLQNERMQEEVTYLNGQIDELQKTIDLLNIQLEDKDREIKRLEPKLNNLEYNV